MSLVKIKFILLLLPLLFIGCTAGSAIDVPELLVPVSVQHDSHIVGRGRIARFSQYRSIVRVESEGVFFRSTPLPFGGFEVVEGQEVRQGDVLARLNTGAIEAQMENRRERIADLQAEHRFQNRQMEIAIEIAQLELQQEPTDLKRLEVERLQLELRQAREWQAFSLSYYESSLTEMTQQMAEAELLAPHDGVVTYRADIRQGTWIEAFRNIVYISDGQNLFVEYIGVTTPMIMRGSNVYALIAGNYYALERIILPPNEILYYIRYTGMAPFRFTFIDPPSENVRLGLFAPLLVYDAVLEDVLRVPPNAVFRDALLGNYVNLIGENGQRTAQPVEVGLRTDPWVEITAGLLEGDEILVQQ